MDKLYERQYFVDESEPALSAETMNKIAKAIDDIDDRVIKLSETTGGNIYSIADGINPTIDTLYDGNAKLIFITKNYINQENTEGTQSGLRYNANNGVCLFSGTSTKALNFWLGSTSGTTMKPGKYYFGGMLFGSNITMDIVDFASSEVIASTDSYQIGEFTVTEPNKKYRAVLRIPKGTYNDEEVRPMVSNDSNISFDNFVPYAYEVRSKDIVTDEIIDSVTIRASVTEPETYLMMSHNGTQVYTDYNTDITVMYPISEKGAQVLDSLAAMYLNIRPKARDTYSLGSATFPYSQIIGNLLGAIPKDGVSKSAFSTISANVNTKSASFVLGNSKANGGYSGTVNMYNGDTQYSTKLNSSGELVNDVNLTLPKESGTLATEEYVDEHGGGGGGLGVEIEYTDWLALPEEQRMSGNYKVLNAPSGDMPNASQITYKNDVSVGAELDTINQNLKQLITGTIPSGETSITLFSNNIKIDSIIDIYFENRLLSPTEITVMEGSITIEINSEDTDVNVGVRVL